MEHFYVLGIIVFFIFLVADPEIPLMINNQNYFWIFFQGEEEIPNSTNQRFPNSELPPEKVIINLNLFSALYMLFNFGWTENRCYTRKCSWLLFICLFIYIFFSSFFLWFAFFPFIIFFVNEINFILSLSRYQGEVSNPIFSHYFFLLQF